MSDSPKVFCEAQSISHRLMSRPFAPFLFSLKMDLSRFRYSLVVVDKEKP